MRLNTGVQTTLVPCRPQRTFEHFRRALLASESLASATRLTQTIERLGGCTNPLASLRLAPLRLLCPTAGHRKVFYPLDFTSTLRLAQDTADSAQGTGSRIIDWGEFGFDCEV